MESTSYVLARYSEGFYAGAGMESDAATIGKNIKRLRERAGLRTQGELAAKLGVPQPQASDWENDRYNWENAKVNTLIRIAVAVGSSLDELIAGTDLASDLVCHSPEYQSAPPTKDGADDARAAFDRSLSDRLADAEAGLSATLELLGTIRSELDQRAAPGRHEKRRARR